MVAWVENFLLLAPSIFELKEIQNNAKNKNKSICSKTIQKNRNRKNYFLKVPCKSYFNEKIYQTEKVFEKKPLY